MNCGTHSETAAETSKEVFPCARCGRHVDAAKIKRGVDFVFCCASCVRLYQRFYPDGAERQRHLKDFHNAVSAYLSAARTLPEYDDAISNRMNEVKRQVLAFQKL